MFMPNGKEMWLLTKYQELNSFNKIVFLQYQSHENGEILPPPMPNWPKEIIATIMFKEEKGITNMRFIWLPIKPTKEEAQAWEASRSQHGKGWGGRFDVLTGYLAKC
ncbi:MAG: hypothetical protein ACI9FB_003695 [Candidatus Azotimanducaceae bacterium]|jgi:hypothetical protein